MMNDCIVQNHAPFPKPPFDCKIEITEPDNGNHYRRCMFKEANRLKTFAKWLCPYVKPEQLAKCGFYYTQRTDCVRCAFCNIEIGCWEPGDDPEKDHYRWTGGKCPFLRKEPCGNVPIEDDPTVAMNEGQDTCGKHGIEIRPYSRPERDAELSEGVDLKKLGIEPSHGPAYPQFVLLEQRLASFAEWPPSLKQTPKQLAEAGFFYNQKGDQTVCFYCAGGLKDWVENDDPWEQHARWFSKCNFLRLQKGDQFISEVCNRLKATLSPQEASELQTVEAGDLNRVPPQANNLNKSPTLNGVKSLINLNVAKREPTHLPQTNQETYTKEPNPEPNRAGISSRTMCKICYSKEVGVLFLPCGHIVACVDCAPALSTCAVCRKPLEASVRAFLS